MARHRRRRRGRSALLFCCRVAPFPQLRCQVEQHDGSSPAM
jgi:hypothetical protein